MFSGRPDELPSLISSQRPHRKMYALAPSFQSASPVNRWSSAAYSTTARLPGLSVCKRLSTVRMRSGSPKMRCNSKMNMSRLESMGRFCSRNGEAHSIAAPPPFNRLTMHTPLEASLGKWRGWARNANRHCLTKLRQATLEMPSNRSRPRTRGMAQGD